ncbi:MAG: hypothetical protein OXI15_16615 [Chromatiales bacterium]|nr:hypothetical protein [Chromatiales bacterium]
MSTTIILVAILVLLAILTIDALRFRLRQKEMRKHDQVLLPVSELHRDVTNFLYLNAIGNLESLSPREYRYILDLVKILDDTIHNYSQHETSVFDVHEIAEHFRTYRRMSKAVSEAPDHPEIQKFDKRIRSLWLNAFLAYTPLIRWEFSDKFHRVLARLALRLICFAYRIGKQKTRLREAVYVMESAEKVRNDARGYA